MSQQSFLSEANRKGSENDYQGLVIKTLYIPMAFNLITQEKLCCFFKILLNQARNQEFFRAGEFSWNYGTSINIHLQHEKESFRREKISGFFAWKLLKIAF